MKQLAVLRDRGIARMRRAAAVAMVMAVAWLATPAHAAAVTGRVVAHGGAPIEYANVTVPALKLGTVTDDQGRFELTLPPGRHEIVASQIGFQVARLVVDADRREPLSITLQESPVPVSEVVVTASSFGKVGKSEGATLRRMDIVMTPGGTADVFQALRTLPSINAPNEGAALYVRGGDPHETLIRLDGGELGHPYHYEDASGGLFSSFDAYMLKSAFFSSGGFSAKYGGVLSGVLDIESQDPWNLRTISVGANMVGAGMSTSWALVPDRVSFVGSIRFSRLELLDRVYGTTRDYLTLPSSVDGAGKLLMRYSPTGRVSVIALGAGDHVAVQSQRYNFDGLYRGHNRNGVLAAQWQDVIGEHLAVSGNASYQRYWAASNYGVLDTDHQDQNAQAAVDAVWDASDRQRLSFGAGVRRLDADLSGVYPADSTDLGDDAARRFQSGHPVATTPGFYVEDQVRVWGPVYATVGARADYASSSRAWTLDPRGAVAWRIDKRQTLRLAAGRYHQLPRTIYLDPVYGNPELSPMAADHVIAGYERKTETSNLRLEAYRKDYRDLVTRSDTRYYANDGHGYARGVDVFAQRVIGRVNGWISYGYLDSRRKELSDPHEVPSSYGVTHALSVVATVQVRPMLSLGARWSAASGRPYTPIVGGQYDAGTGRWSPIQAENNSGQLPAYDRLDVRATRLFTLPGAAGLPASSVCVLYIEALNVLDQKNVLDYAYSEDYSSRTEVPSYFSKRMAVAGFALTW